MEKHYMIDIETTGVDKDKDSILEIAMVEVEYKYPYWHPTGREFHKILPYSGQPESVFAKKHMSDLYAKCNEASSDILKTIHDEITAFVHNIDIHYIVHEPYIEKSLTPKFFMGWNASNFDIPFMFKKNLLQPSYYKKVSGDKEELRGDVHYRIYEQTGALNLASNASGLSRSTVKKMAEDLNPTGIELPQGKAHDALYDCYWQIIMLNGLIAVSRLGVLK